MKTINDIKQQLELAQGEERDQLLDMYKQDPRKGVVNLVARFEKEKEKIKQERLRLNRMQSYEREYAHMGAVCGIDEAGRGPLAGPVVAGAVILPPDHQIFWLNDSKQLSSAKRDELYDQIMEEAVAVGVGYASPARIDEINILQATYEE